MIINYYFGKREIKVAVVSREWRGGGIHFLYISSRRFSRGSPERVHLSARGEHGRHLGEDAPGRRRGFLRRRLPGGLAGQQNEEEVSGLEEETAPG